MTNDLISREALRKGIKAIKEGAETFHHPTYRTGYVVALSTVEGMLADAPTVDAAPVVHDCWIEHESSYDGELECARCHTRFDGEIWYMQMGYRGNPKHCPNCGAKMDKEETDE